MRRIGRLRLSTLRPNVPIGDHEYSSEYDPWGEDEPSTPAIKTAARGTSDRSDAT